MLNKNNHQPLVSIIMPTYNRGNIIKEAISKIISQSYKNIELIIINDCSTDDTINILNKIAESDYRIKIINNEKNIKLVKSLNEGIKKSSGKYIARADDDDIWINHMKLENQINFLENNPEYSLIGTGAIMIDDRGKEIFRYLEPKEDRDIRKKILIGNPFIHSSVVFTRKILERTNLYDENLKDAEDWDLWLRIGQYSKLYNIQSYDVYRFYGERGLSIKNRRNISKTRLHLIKKYKKYYPNFERALIFNYIQRIYTFIPYIKKIDNILFKLKRKII